MTALSNAERQARWRERQKASHTVAETAVALERRRCAAIVRWWYGPEAEAAYDIEFPPGKAGLNNPKL